MCLLYFVEEGGGGPGHQTHRLRMSQPFYIFKILRQRLMKSLMAQVGLELALLLPESAFMLAARPRRGTFLGWSEGVSRK